MSDLSTGALLRLAIVVIVMMIAAHVAGIVFIVQSSAIGTALGLSRIELLLVASAALSMVPRVWGPDKDSPPSSIAARIVAWVLMAALYGLFLQAQGLGGLAQFAALLLFLASLSRATSRLLAIAPLDRELKRRRQQLDDIAITTSGAASA